MAARVTKKSHPAVKHRSVRWSRLKWRWPFIVWLALVALAFYLFLNSSGLDKIRGQVTSERQWVAPLETARVEEILVDPTEEVKRGQLLARMDGSLLEKEITMERQQAQMDLLDRRQDIQRNIYNLRSTLQEYQIAKRSTEAELRQLEVELEILERQEQERAGSVNADLLSRRRSQVAALREAASSYPTFIDEVQKDLEKATASLDRLDQEVREVEGIDGGQSIEEFIRKRLENYALYAAHDGRVKRIYRSEGDVVPEGEPIMEIVISGAQKIIAFVPEDSEFDLDSNTIYSLSDVSGAPLGVQAKVTGYDPTFEAVPDASSPLPDKMIIGRRVTLEPTSPYQFTPGQTVWIHGDKKSFWQRFDEFFNVHQ